MKRSRKPKRWWLGTEADIPVYDYPGWDLPGLAIGLMGTIFAGALMFICAPIRWLHGK